MQKKRLTMKIYEAINRRIQEPRKERRLSGYALIYQAVIPPSTVKNILHGKSTNPGTMNIRKMAEGSGVAIREFYDSGIPNDLGWED